MPSAANIKVDKQITSETASVDSASNQQNTPIKQAIIIIEHKIRNLEKRKVKLESYRELQNSGKDLNQDQRVAIAKYDEVVQTLDFARELCKQFQGIAAIADKEQKKLARKEVQMRSQQEIVKVREILLIQDALTQLGQENIREDFLVGRNGAVTLTENDLKVLDDIYPEVSPKHEPGSPINFTTQVQTAAEHLLAIVDGKSKEVVGTTYQHVKEVIGKIHESGYLDQAVTENNDYDEVGQEVVEEETKLESQITEITIENSGGTAVIPSAPTGYHVDAHVVPEDVQIVPPPAAATAVVAAAAAVNVVAAAAAAVPPVLEQQQQPPPPAQQQPAFFQQPRPISEVLGPGKFYFLQDSELDSLEQTPQNPAVITNAAIPSQTFTNQNFVNMAETVVPRQNPIAGYAPPPPPNPPPPIPMPPSHLPGIEFATIAQMPPNTYNAYQQSSVPNDVAQVTSHPQQQQQPPSHHPADLNSRTGVDEIQKPSIDDNMNSGNGSPKNGPRSRNQNQRRNGRPQHDSGYHQSSYYQHNNGYSNRQRPGGGRGGGGNSGSRGGNRPPMQNKSKVVQH